MPKLFSAVLRPLGHEHALAALLLLGCLVVGYNDVACRGRTFFMLNRGLGTLPYQTLLKEYDENFSRIRHSDSTSAAA